MPREHAASTGVPGADRGARILWVAGLWRVSAPCGDRGLLDVAPVVGTTR